MSAGVAPSCRRLVSVKINILFPVEEIEHCARDAYKAVEITNRRGVHVDTAQATELRFEIADACLAAIESLSAPAEAAEKMEVGDFPDVRGGHHAAPPVFPVAMNTSASP
jgi:hypothetical protein